MSLNHFSNGNYNEFESIVNSTLPDMLSKVRNELLPKIEQVFMSMIGRTSDIECSRLSGFFNIEENKFIGIKVELSYIIPDFKVMNAPQEAIDEDQEAIKNYLSAESVEIDTNSGSVNIIVLLNVEEDNDNN